jgi:hypothetical protein
MSALIRSDRAEQRGSACRCRGSTDDGPSTLPWAAEGPRGSASSHHEQPKLNVILPLHAGFSLRARQPRVLGGLAPPRVSRWGDVLWKSLQARPAGSRCRNCRAADTPWDRGGRLRCRCSARRCGTPSARDAGGIDSILAVSATVFQGENLARQYSSFSSCSPLLRRSVLLHGGSGTGAADCSSCPCPCACQLHSSDRGELDCACRGSCEGRRFIILDGSGAERRGEAADFPRLYVVGSSRSKLLLQDRAATGLKVGAQRVRDGPGHRETDCGRSGAGPGRAAGHAGTA